MKRIIRFCALLAVGAFLSSTYGCSGQQESKTIPYNENGGGAAPTDKGAGVKKSGGPPMPGP